MKKTIFVLTVLIINFMLLQMVSAATPISSCTTINSQGTYYLTADIINSGNTICLDITANNVVLDCRGHTIDGILTQNTYGIQVKRSSSTNTNVIIKNCVSTNWDYGIYLKYANNNVITDNTANSNRKGGIYLHLAENNTIKNNIANENNYLGGILLHDADTNIIENNNANSNEFQGIYMYYSNNNTINHNTIKDNKKIGLYISYSDKNTIMGNTINSNNLAGITTSNAYNNLIYNNRLNNTNNAVDICNNFWNTTNSTGPNIVGGLYIGGNYFSDYNGADSDGDGFGDTPHNLPVGNNKDLLPLTAIPEVPTIFLSMGLMFLSLLKMKRKIK